MWIQRQSDEVNKWQKAAEHEARSHGRLIAGIVWILVSIGAAGGSFFIMGGTALVFQRDVSGSFWLRLPLFGLITAPFAYWLFRHERRRELAKIAQRTICPGCDRAAEGNAGAACPCGGSFVLSSIMKWIGK